MQLEQFLQSKGLSYRIARQTEPIRTETGLPNHEKATGRAYIGFLPEIDVVVGDMLINPAGDRFYVIETRTDFVQKKPFQLKAYYQSEIEHRQMEDAQKTFPTFNIQNAYGSVIGTNNHAVINYDASIQSLREQISESTSPDKEDIEKIISLLEMVVHDQVPPSKGLFSKFRDVMERNSWLSSSVSGAILSWLTTKIP